MAWKTQFPCHWFCIILLGCHIRSAWSCILMHWSSSVIYWITVLFGLCLSWKRRCLARSWWLYIFVLSANFIIWPSILYLYHWCIWGTEVVPALSLGVRRWWLAVSLRKSLSSRLAAFLSLTSLWPSLTYYSQFPETASSSAASCEEQSWKPC